MNFEQAPGLRGTIMDGGILCSCSSCDGRRVSSSLWWSASSAVFHLGECIFSILISGYL